MVTLVTLVPVPAWAQGGQPEALHECTLVDGSAMVMAHDLSDPYPQSVLSCKPLAAPEPHRVVGTWYGASRFTPSLRVITAPPRGTLAQGSPTGLPSPIPADLLEPINDACQQQRLDCRLVLALIHVESRFRTAAQSPKGALGLMQIMPATGRRFGVENPLALLEPTTNLAVGTRYLAHLLRLFDGRVELALAAFNAGEGAVMRHGHAVPPFAETQAYVRDVLQLAGDWKALDTR